MANTPNGWMDFIYVMTNALPNNEIIAFAHTGSGQLMRLGSYQTGGSGSGAPKVDPLSSQGSVTASQDGRFLFAVNAGSNTISSFQVMQNGTLLLKSTGSSGGMMPNSIAVAGNLLYVSNAGASMGASSITGFNIAPDGVLRPIPGAAYMLSAMNVAPACLAFSPDGKRLVVSERSTDSLSVYTVGMDGMLRDMTFNDSSGAGPFGCVFLQNGTLLVVEAGANALSSYRFMDSGGTLSTISGSVRNGQSAACWVSAGMDGRYAYTSNAGSGSITQYGVGMDGSLNAITSSSSTPAGAAAPLDNMVSRDGQHLYVLNGNEGSVSMFRIQPNGSLMGLQVMSNTGLPGVGAQGMAVV